MGLNKLEDKHILKKCACTSFLEDIYFLFYGVKEKILVAFVVKKIVIQLDILTKLWLTKINVTQGNEVPLQKTLCILHVPKALKIIITEKNGYKLNLIYTHFNHFFILQSKRKILFSNLHK